MQAVMASSRASLAPTGGMCIHKAGDFSGRFYGLFFCLEKGVSHSSLKNNQMNKYDLWIYKSPVKVTSIKARSHTANRHTAQGIT
ncbi:hypothetical protein FQ192_20985 [Pseudomonas sp. ANT_J12]|uniref:hypothetical protein n=1 Tax=Pseudomonas sp. ANT_J12 TaxID=2597351 RepID=UPI0011F1789F|nr:hypothetical protein [Pseudomonas sp. ANT_J12]KAA0987469.1 hypothetical protein FQ192_20985 [Pseudomonas sp. ANT_J12]